MRGTRNHQSELKAAGLGLLLILLASYATARCPDTPDHGIVANPNRPTVANPADITQFGVLEVEYGYDHAVAGRGERQNDLEGLFKFAVACNLEIRWDTDSFVRQSTPGNAATGFGDNSIGFQYRFYRQSTLIPSLAFGYSLKLPSARANLGLGTGKYDHHLTFLASKDIATVHFDFNTSYFFFGRDGGGTDQNAEMNLAFSHRLYRNLAFTGEFYGDTNSNTNAPPSANGLWAFTYAITPRLVIDAGMDHGLKSAAEFRRRDFVGVTYSIADIYRALRPAPRN